MGRAADYPVETPAANDHVYGNQNGNFVQFPIGDLGASSIGLATGIATLTLNTGPLAGVNTFQTDGYYAVGDYGRATYYRKSVLEAAQTGDKVSADGVRIGLAPGQTFYPQQFGAVAAIPTPATDSWQAITDALNNPNVIILNFVNYYNVSKAIQVFDRPRVLRGLNESGIAELGSAAYLVFPANCAGIVVHNYKTTADATGTVFSFNSNTDPNTSAAGTIISNITLQGGATTNGGWVPARAGIRTNTKIYVSEVVIRGFYGAGIFVQASVGSSDADTFGNANNCYFNSIVAISCGWHGIYMNGSDANSCSGYSIQTHACFGFGIADLSALGNYWFAHSTSTCGYGSLCSYGGNQYYTIDAATAIANRPDLHPETWALVGAGGVNSNFRDWSLGGPWIEGGSRAATNLNARTTFFGIYDEGDSYPSNVKWPSIQWGGFVDVGRGDGAVFGSGSMGNIRSIGINNPGGIGLTVQGGFTATNPLARLWHTSTASGSIQPQILFTIGYKVDGVTPHDVAGIMGGASGNNTTNGRGFLQYWDAGLAAMTSILFWGNTTPGVYPGLDNTYPLGSSSFRWSDVRTVLLNGVAPVLAGAVTSSPLTMTTARILGRTTASTGAIEQITVGNGLAMSAGNLAVTPAAAQANSTAAVLADLVTDFNSLLTKLRTANLLAP